MKNQEKSKTICPIYSHSIKQIMYMMHWSNQNKDTLNRFNLIGIKRLNEDVFTLNSGLIVPTINCGKCTDENDRFSEDRNENREFISIARMILDGNIHLLIFFTKSDELYEHNRTDALINTAINKDIFFALNKKTADFMITSNLINSSIPDHKNANHELKENETKITIALIAHDTEPKYIMRDLCKEYKDILMNPNVKLVGTSGTIKKIKSMVPELQIEDMGHGPDGGDIVIAEKIFSREINIMFFFIDTTDFKPHYREIQTLIDAAVDANTAFALNRKTASAILTSDLLFQK